MQRVLRHHASRDGRKVDRQAGSSHDQVLKLAGRAHRRGIARSRWPRAWVLQASRCGRELPARSESLYYLRSRPRRPDGVWSSRLLIMAWAMHMCQASLDRIVGRRPLVCVLAGARWIRRRRRRSCAGRAPCLHVLSPMQAHPLFYIAQLLIIGPGLGGVGDASLRSWRKDHPGVRCR